jgi:hypothetical protein
MRNFEIHKCAQPSVIDKTGTLRSNELTLLSQGLKVVSLSRSEKMSSLSQVVQTLGGTFKEGDSDLSVSVPASKFKKTSLGPFVGLDAQTVIALPRPARSVRLPRPTNDLQLGRLNSLRKNGVFKKSDKGSSLVYLTKAIYVSSGKKHLNTANYKVVEGPSDEGLLAMQQLVDITHQQGSKPATDLIARLCLTFKRQRFIYFLPKIHKPLDIDGWFKVRPIVDCRDTALAAADQVAAKFLSPLNKHMFTIAGSTIDLLTAIHNTITVDINAIFYVADVEDLYTNVPIDESTDACKILLDEFAIGDPHQRTLIISMLKITLLNNIFCFAGTWYRQLHGIPMGSNSAPIVADAFLFFLERKLVSSAIGIRLFKRYRDDIFAIAETEAHAIALDTGYKALHPRIRLESTFSSQRANVLDVAISKFEEDGSLRLGVYFKPTNSLPLLHRSSNHPLITLHGAIKGRFISFIRICNNTTDLFSAIFSLVASATKYGYTEQEVMALAHDAITQCSTRPWPYLRPSETAPKDYRTDNVLVYSRILEPLYAEARRRKIKISLAEGQNLMKKLCRTKDC